MYNKPFIKLSELEKTSTGLLGWIMRASPWVRKGMALRRTTAPLGYSSKALTSGLAKYRPVTKWHQMNPLQAWTGSVLNPMYKVEAFARAAMKNPQGVGALSRRAKKSFVHTTRPAGGGMGLLVRKKPIVPGGNIYRRTPGGIALHGVMGTGIGFGAVDAALTQGSVAKKLKTGAKTSVAWGPLRTLTLTKMLGYELPKGIKGAFAAPPRLPRQPAAHWQNQNINYPY